jgi:hypothetical protein
MHFDFNGLLANLVKRMIVSFSVDVLYEELLAERLVADVNLT